MVQAGLAMMPGPLMVVLLRLAGDTRENTLGVRLIGIVGGLLILAGYFVFRAYDVPDEVRGRVPPEAATPLVEELPAPAG